MEKLNGKIAVVTGGGSGIGQAIAVRFAKEGANVIIVGRRESVLKETAELDDKITYVVGDITDSNIIKNIVNTINEKFNGRLDILVNNAGWCPVKPITEMTIEDYDNAFNLDVRALVDITIQTLPFIIKSKGNIINLSSVGVTHRSLNLSMYQGAKASVENFTRVWALELADKNVRVNAIAPGAIRTDIWNVPGLTEEEAKKHEEGIASTIPMKKFGTSEDIANVALFLVSEEANYVTGSIYSVDGGMGAL